MAAYGEMKIRLQISAIKLLISTITFSYIKNSIIDIKNSYPRNE